MQNNKPIPIETDRYLPSWTPRLSLVVPTYNVARYLDTFLKSVFNQSSQTQRFEVIIVDDGSTDASGSIARCWAKKHPEHIRYIRQENFGLAEARNTGLAAARGTWVSFPDPDDFLDRDYFRVILEQTVVKHLKPLLMIVAKLLPYYEDTDTSVDNHPLNYRFRHGLRYIDTRDLGDFIHLSAASCWFERATLQSNKLRFNPRVKPVFEDGHLVAKLLMLSPDRTIAIVPKAIYNYRKRADASSLVMGAKTDRNFYLDSVEYGYLDLMLFAQIHLGYVPYFVQRVCLYELQSRINYLTGDDARIAILTEAEQDHFNLLVEKVFEDISLETIQTFQIGRFNNQNRIGLIGRFKPSEATTELLYVEKFDPTTRNVRFSYFTPAGQEPCVQLISKAKTLKLTNKSSHWTTMQQKKFLGQHWFHAVLPKAGETIAYADGVELTLRHLNRNFTQPLTCKSLTKFLRPTAPINLPEQAIAERTQIANMPEKYEAAWLLMDTPMLANRDAEHLYRHLKETHQDSNIWFVLSVMSPDWNRLMAAGFKLLPFGCLAHLAALIHAEFLVTSCADISLHWPRDPSLFADLTQIRTVILPQENLLPKKGMDYLCVYSRQSANALTGTDQKFRRFSSELRVTGAPRHDQLWQGKPIYKTVLIAPDWLSDLCTDNGENPLTKKPFETSDIANFRAFWAEFFCSSKMSQLKKDYSLRILVITGRQLANDPILDGISDQVEIFEPGLTPQLLAQGMAQAGLVVTDQTDLGYDASFLGRRNLLCRQTLSKSRLPIPEEMRVSETVNQLMAQIVAHYHPQPKASNTRKLKPFFQRGSSTACERVCSALLKLSSRKTLV